MIIKESVLDRLSQSFYLFKDNFLWLFLPFFLYNFISIVMVWTISKYYIMKNISWMWNVEWLDYFNVLNDPAVVMWIVIGVLLFLIYLLLYIVILLWFLKSMNQVVLGEKVDVISNLKYWISNFKNSMKTYWYIFSYIALIPSFFFIIGWLLFNFAFYMELGSSVKEIWWLFMIIWVLLFIVFAIYRWTKAVFPLYSAVYNDNYSKGNFLESINITNNNWWRIIWNLLLIGLLTSLIMSIIGWLIWIISFFWSGWASLIEWISSIVINWSQSWDFNISNIKTLLDWYVNNFSILWEILWNTIDNILWTISTVYLLIFTYLFFLRLSNESKIVINDSENKNVIEL